VVISPIQPFHFTADAARALAGGEQTRDHSPASPANQVAELGVLIVDDQAGRRGILTKQLRSGLDQPIRVQSAASGRSAVLMLRLQTFDLVLIEYALPDGDGLELVQRIAEFDDRMALILVTDHGNETLAARAIQSGALGYLVRGSITPASLGRTATTAIRTARLEDNNRQRVQHMRDAAEHTAHCVRALSHDMTAGMMVLEDSLTRVENACREEGISNTIRDGFAHVKACLDQSKRLLDDLVSLAGTGSLDAEPHDVDITQVLTKVLYEQGARMDERGVEVTIDPELGAARCHPNRLHQLLTNLIRNALLHGCDVQDPKLSIGRAESYGSDGDARTWLRVWDNGGGIPRDAREQVFLPGKRFAATAGTGMGLAIVQRIVSQYGGTVFVDPAWSDGTAIIFSLPAGAALQRSGPSATQCDFYVPVS
jgi:signal transduction histidine kinase